VVGASEEVPLFQDLLHKGLSRCLSLFKRVEAALLLLASRGGEGEKCGGSEDISKLWSWPAMEVRRDFALLLLLLLPLLQREWLVGVAIRGGASLPRFLLCPTVEARGEEYWWTLPDGAGSLNGGSSTTGATTRTTSLPLRF
jgi:hypothetical protein